MNFPGQLPGLLQSGGNAIYYHEMDFDSQSAVVMRLAADGSTGPLPFTETETPSQFLHYVVSPDGQQIAWSASRQGETGEPVSDLWLAGTDGSEKLQLLDAVPARENRFIVPIRFSPDGQILYYAVQPIGIGGSWTSFSGRYDSLEAISVSGGLGINLFQCPVENLLCLGDFSGNSEELLLAYTDLQNKSILIVAAHGEAISQYDFPEVVFLGYPTFGPAGEFAFYTATIGEHADGYPVPQPGSIHVVQPPYEGDPQRVISDESVATLIGWLDGEHVVYNSIDQDGNWGTAVTDLPGSGSIWSSSPSQFNTILR